MKYIDADRLKEAVEKKYNSNDTVGDRWDLGYDTACEQILSIIDSLQQEQPPEDLEAEVRTYCKSSFKFNYDELNDSFYSNAFGFDDIAELARHFYELGKNSK